MLPVLNSPDYNYIRKFKHKRAELMQYFADNYEEFQVAMKNPATSYWSKWDSFTLPKHSNISTIESCYDLHRTICDFEIVIETDYPTYEENVEAMKYIGELFELLNYTTNYYYSGNKSIHCHIFVDYNQFKPVFSEFVEQFKPYIKTVEEFKRMYIEYEREVLSRLQDKYQVDEQLIHGKHLIRSEMSKNKNGFKCFLGNTYKDIPPLPYICNTQTGIIPEGNISLNTYTDPQAKLRDFLSYVITTSNKCKKTTELNLKTNQMRPVVSELYESPEIYNEDGKKRVLFIIVNELKNNFDYVVAREFLLNWNQKLQVPFKEKELEYLLNRTSKYYLTTQYILKVKGELYKPKGL
jgi:hypothetical protein